MHPPGLQRFALTRDALRRRRAPTACAEPTTGPHTLATPCPVLPTHSGMTFATRCLMRRVLGFLAGVLVGQWLVFWGGRFRRPICTFAPPPPGSITTIPRRSGSGARR